jgi:hypothetical protein
VVHVLRQQAASVLACDFLTVETAFLQRIYVLFFYLARGPADRVRRVHLETGRTLADAAGAQPRDAAGRRAAVPLPHPRPGRDLLGGLIHEYEAA